MKHQQELRQVRKCTTKRLFYGGFLLPLELVEVRKTPRPFPLCSGNWLGTWTPEAAPQKPM
jgi:hypothetical protein